MNPHSATRPPNGRDILKKFGTMVLGHQSTLLVGAGLMAIPAAWITKVHMDWKHNPDAKKRMLIAQATFWTSMLAGFKVLHAALFALPDRKVLLPKGFFSLLRQLAKPASRGPAAATLTVIAAGLGGFIASMIGGFEGGTRLAKKLIPKQAKNSWNLDNKDVERFTYSVPTSFSQNFQPIADTKTQQTQSIEKQGLVSQAPSRSFPIASASLAKPEVNANNSNGERQQPSAISFAGRQFQQTMLRQLTTSNSGIMRVCIGRTQ